MTNRTRQRGFTLIEILVAVALISIVLSMVYGTYVTTTRSAQACKSRIVLCEQGRTTLEQIARHIRCSYAGSEPEPAAEDVEAGSDRTQVVSVEDVEYFNGNAKALLALLYLNEPWKSLFVVSPSIAEERAQ